MLIVWCARSSMFTLCYAKSTPRTTAGKAAVRAARQKQPGQSMHNGEQLVSMQRWICICVMRCCPSHAGRARHHLPVKTYRFACKSTRRARQGVVSRRGRASSFISGMRATSCNTSQHTSAVPEGIQHRRARASKNNTTHEPAIVAARRAAQSGIGRRRRAGLSPARLVGARTTPTRRRCLWTSSTARPTALRLRRRPGRVDLPQRKGRRSPSGHHALEQGGGDAARRAL